MMDKLRGIWRSYKVFCFSGKIEPHTDASYIELEITTEGSLSLLHSRAKKDAVIQAPGQWAVEEIKRRRYLYFGKKQAYEIITLEATDLVLHDIAKGEKIFFAIVPEWNRRVEPEINSIRYIRPNEVARRKKNF